MHNKKSPLTLMLSPAVGQWLLIALIFGLPGVSSLQAASQVQGDRSVAAQPASVADNDGDGIRNQDDRDDDNDGILDTDEGLVDADYNGVPDSASSDTDGDGVPDVLDPDSDNDGILDLLEARGDREAIRALDQIPDGAIDIGIDAGGNGIADIIETQPDSGVLVFTVQDTDADGVADFRDRDSDNDEIYDVIEAGAVDTDSDGRLDGFRDQDGNGVHDDIQASALPIFDTDGDGLLDYIDPDSDNDGISDRIEGGPNRSAPIDTDTDGEADFRDTDSDSDGIPDRLEVGENPSEPLDSDGDGIADFRDADPLVNAMEVAAGSGTDTGTNTSTGTDPGADMDQGNTANAGSGSEGAAGDTAPHRPDRDDDGIANQDDLDDDNDGILDSAEGGIDADGDGFPDAASIDSDGDGTPNVYDLDSDNDGILDNLEARLDFSLVRSLDQVRNGAIDNNQPVGSNGVADVIETTPDSGLVNYTLVDSDGDGTPDVIDIDSDGDGISDLVEAGGVDADNDGRIDNFVDDDTKGVDDAVQASALPIFDTDGDGVPDFRDTDSDNDTLSDRQEAGSVPNQPVDTDNDGAPDYRELDSDGDGIPDNGVNVPVVIGDSDADGVNNDVDIDDDNDGIPDTVEGSLDSDGDGVANLYDLDSDNDGLFDSQEATADLALVAGLDNNGDGRIAESAIGVNGFADVLETTEDSGVAVITIADSDADGVPDFLDIDSDNDSIVDASEAGLDVNVSGGRLDSASVVDGQGLAAGAGTAWLDTDGDGVMDTRDLDSDNDGICDLLEARGSDADGDCRMDDFSDANGDGADDGIQRTTTAMIDTDGDNVSDFRDLDSDQDSVSDLLETHGTSLDLDNDGVLDNFTDADGDGRDDNSASNPTPLKDTDHDGLPDQVDLDSDGDGISDLEEAGGADSDADGIVDTLLDTDADGVPDIVDADQTGGADTDSDGVDDVADVDFVAGADSDGDGIIDLLDPDSDGDGFAGPSDDGQGNPAQVPDTDGDGTPDFQQGSGDLTPRINSSSGCAVSTANVGSSDPLLTLLLLGAVLVLLSRLQMVRRRFAISRVILRKPAGISAVALSALFLPACSSLDFSGDNELNRRVYVGGGLLVSHLDPDADSDSTVSVDEKQSAGGSLAIGYDISNRFSVEGHVADLGSATLRPTGDIDYQVGGLSALLYGINDAHDRARRERFSLYGRLGLGTMRNQSDVDFERLNDYHLLAGLGAEYGFDNGLALRAEAVAHETDAKYAQLGLVYRFGDAGSRRAPALPREPETAARVDAAPDAKQPELLDADADGINDKADQCLGTGVGVPVDSTGCELFAGVVEGVNFESGSDVLTAEAQQVLDGVAQTLGEFPAIRVSIDAHTDNQGSAQSNLQLSKRRAVAVARYLVEQGVAGNRLKPQAFGESQPVASNAEASGRARNRRVEFQVLQ